jgi:hypothetical protein
MAAKSKVKNLPRNTKNRALISELWDRVSTLESQMKTLNERAIKDGDQVEIGETYKTKSGKVLTDEDIQALADEAEEGYDIEHLKPMPTTPRALAKELGVSDFRVRRYLRQNHARNINLKSRPWSLSPPVVRDARKFFGGGGNDGK